MFDKYALYIIFVTALFLVDKSSKQLTTLCLYIKYFGRSCLRFLFQEENTLKHSNMHRLISDNYINYFPRSRLFTFDIMTNFNCN